MIRSALSRIPIRIIVPLILTLPVLIVAVVLSLVAFTQGRRTTDDLATQLLHEVHGRIQNRVGTLLRVPARVNQINFDAYRMGQLKLDDVEQLDEYFWRQLKTFEEISYIDVGTETGDFVGVERMADGTINLELKNVKTGGALHTFHLDEDMQRMSKKVGVEYDPRSRPWYATGIQAEGPTWSKIYPFFSVPVRLGLTAVRPIRDSNSTVKGVLACDLVLSRIDQFLRSLEIGKTGSAFIIEQDGMLVASSSKHTSVLKVGDKIKRVHALEFKDTAIRTAAAHIRERFGDFSFINKDLYSSFELGGETILLQIRPIRDKGGLNWLVVTLVPERDFMAAIEVGRRRSIAIGASAVIITILLGMILAMVMVRPFLSLLSQLRKIAGGDLEHEVHLTQTPEFRQLSNEINKMTAGLRERMQLQQSLAVAMQVQQSLLPSKTPIIEGLDIAGHSTYCDETGGDYYDFLDVVGLSKSSLAVAIGDVVGHGIAAAMLMATVRGILVSHCDETGSLSELLTHMNKHFIKDFGSTGAGSGPCRFMTMLLMIIDMDAQEVRWASAGHDPPFVYDSENEEFINFDLGNTPLGIVQEEVFEEYTFSGVRSGQIYLAATDGVWETMSATREMFGKDRVQDIIRKHAHMSAAGISEQLRNELVSFGGKLGQNDDVTFVVVKVNACDKPD